MNKVLHSIFQCSSWAARAETPAPGRVQTTHYAESLVKRSEQALLPLTAAFSRSQGHGKGDALFSTII